MAGIDYKMVRELVPMSRVLELIGFTAVARKGKQLRGPCPVHRSSSPLSRSFSVNLATNAFRCFTCGAAGNQLDLWRRVQGLSLFEAAIELCQHAQVASFVQTQHAQPLVGRSREEEPVKLVSLRWA
jgi:DNA primase